MAVKWAVVNQGDWNTPSTWNDGVVPTSNDDVYCNGYIILINSSSIISVKSISNYENPNTGRGGGQISRTTAAVGGLFINADCRCFYNTLINLVNVGSLTITGNCYCPTQITQSQLIYQGSGNSGFQLTIVGNVHQNGLGFLYYGATVSCKISVLNVVGSVYCENVGAPCLVYDTINCVISGDLSARIQPFTDLNISNLTVYGILTAYGININVDNFNTYGGIRYTRNNVNPLLCGINAKSATIHNPDTFTWKDITEPRSNPFIILTDAEMNNHQQYPAENEVKEGTEYVWGEKVGTYQAPPESVVLKDYIYDNGDKVGTLENQTLVGCVTKEDVREGVELVGMGEVGTLVVPSVDDVREGVVFDNGSVGTLIVEGGGDRLRIANFGYYTDSQSDTYIVDINESFKPMFATAEESVLLELFPELDLDDIPDKYFDDLFVKYLKYRLIVEYYRGAGINSVFTPSELTTEVVNYQNVRCEYWLNLANIYLNAWDKKYPNSVKKQRILL